jgi:hypothetical protein
MNNRGDRVIPWLPELARKTIVGVILALGVVIIPLLALLDTGYLGWPFRVAITNHASSAPQP